MDLNVEPKEHYDLNINNLEPNTHYEIQVNDETVANFTTHEEVPQPIIQPIKVEPEPPKRYEPPKYEAPRYNPPPNDNCWLPTLSIKDSLRDPLDERGSAPLNYSLALLSNPYRPVPLEDH